MSQRLIAIVGPTGVGKSALAIRLAQEFGGEIVSADSRQLYRFMDIGTAKPSAQKRALVPHHLVDIINPDEDFSLAQYQEMAYKTIADIQDRGKLPFLVGGSGLYVWAVLENWQVPRVAPDLALRRSLETKAAEGNNLYEELRSIEPEAAARIDRRNVRRVIRALEVRRGGGMRQGKSSPPFASLIIGLTASRAELYRHIDARVDNMIARGLVDEVKGLIKVGYGLELPSMSGIGYRQVGLCLSGELDLDDAIRQTKTESHRLVRQQYNWFKLKDDRIRWFDIEAEPHAEIARLVADFVRARD